MTHTTAVSGAWWQVDLGAIRRIDHLQVINRSDSSQARLNGFVVKLSTNGVTWFDPSGPPGLSFAERTEKVHPGTFIPVKNGARYVRIQLPGTQYLSLAEVMVMGKEQQ